jgi:hypothetical protein
MAAPVEDDLDRMLKERGLVTQMTDQLTLQISNQFNGPLLAARNTFGGKASEIVIQAMGLLGVPYIRGGTSEEKGFDCSGFEYGIPNNCVTKTLAFTIRKAFSVTWHFNIYWLRIIVSRCVIVES